MRLIDADELLKEIDDTIWNNVADYNEARYAVDKAQTVDAVPVRHGKWIPNDSKWGRGEKVFLCDQCNNNVGFAKMNFCPNCGAYMMGEENVR